MTTHLRSVYLNLDTDELPPGYPADSLTVTLTLGEIPSASAGAIVRFAAVQTRIELQRVRKHFLYLLPTFRSNVCATSRCQADVEAKVLPSPIRASYWQVISRALLKPLRS